LHIEANISEANIAAVRNNQSVEVTFDALGADRKFNAKVQGVDPASTLVSGVVNYKVTISLEKLEEVKPGMTANISILTGEKSGVLAAPLRAIISQDGKKFIRIITDPKKKIFEQKEVITGMEGDGGLVEIVSALEEGTEVVTFIKK
jgi:HlyD family secretion protein